MIIGTAITGLAIKGIATFVLDVLSGCIGVILIIPSFAISCLKSSGNG